MDQKSKWTGILFLDVLLFLLALRMNDLLLYIAVIVLSFFIYRDGNTALFKKYDERKKQKQADYKLIQEAAKETICLDQLLKKKRELK